MMQVANLMTSDPATVTPRDTLAAAKAAMDAGRFRRLPVLDNGVLVGILTERDLREHGGYLESTRVSAAMRSPVIVVAPSDEVQVAARLMLKHKVGGLPVVDRGKVIGIVTASDLLKALLNVVEASQRVLNH
jgi:CBS domain-containing protein